MQEVFLGFLFYLGQALNIDILVLYIDFED